MCVSLLDDVLLQETLNSPSYSIDVVLLNATGNPPTTKKKVAVVADPTCSVGDLLRSCAGQVLETLQPRRTSDP